MSSPSCNGIPGPLVSGLAAEALALEALKISKNTAVWRPTPEQIHSLAFKTIVGVPPGIPQQDWPAEPSLTASNQDFGNQIGVSTLDSTYQLRLQTYRALVEKQPLTIYTNRPVDVDFGRWLNPRGVQIEPLP